MPGDLVPFGQGQTGVMPSGDMNDILGAMRPYLSDNGGWDFHTRGRYPADSTYPPMPRYMNPANNISYRPGGNVMPPWSQMTPQQQQMLLQMMMQRGTAGMQLGMGAPPGIVPGQQMMAPGMMPGATMANNPLMNPAAGQMNPAMNQQLMQYLMQLRGQPSMAQMLSPQGGNTWGLGL